MNTKTRIAGGVCLLAVFLFLAVAACAPATPVSSPELASLSESQDQRILLAEESIPSDTSPPVILTYIPSATSPPPTSPPKPQATMEVIATARSAITLGDVHTVEEAGFSFRPVIGYDLHLKPDLATLVNRDGTIILSMTGIPVESVGPLDDRMEVLLSGVGEGMEEFEAGSTYEVEVGQRKGLASDITGRMSGEKVAGHVVMVAASDARLFYFVSLVVEHPGWEGQIGEVDQTIQAIIDSVTFIDPHIQ
jgi:hypothetical protein